MDPMLEGVAWRMRGSCPMTEALSNTNPLWKELKYAIKRSPQIPSSRQAWRGPGAPSDAQHDDLVLKMPAVEQCRSGLALRCSPYQNCCRNCDRSQQRVGLVPQVSSVSNLLTASEHGCSRPVSNEPAKSWRSYPSQGFATGIQPAPARRSVLVGVRPRRRSGVPSCTAW